MGFLTIEEIERYFSMIETENYGINYLEHILLE